ncbi:MAG: alpha/beta hydrolase [Pseudolabrys sp.]
MVSDSQYAKTEIRYAKSGDVHVAYRVFGQGPVDLVFFPGFISHLDIWWEAPGMARWLTRLAESVRVIMFDKRGTGLSDHVTRQAGMDERMDDARAVMDAMGLERAAIMGVSEGGSLASLFAATHPDRCQALVLYGAFARFSSWVATPELLQQFFTYIDTAWGSGASLPNFAPSAAGDKNYQNWWGRFERLGASPQDCIEIMRLNSQIDIADVLPSIHVPTLVIHRKDDVTVSVEGGRELAARIPDARYVELPGRDHCLPVSAAAR